MRNKTGMIAIGTVILLTVFLMITWVITVIKTWDVLSIQENKGDQFLSVGVQLSTNPSEDSNTIPRFGVNYVYHDMEFSLETPEEYISHQNDKLCDIGIGWVRSAGPGDKTSFNWGIIEPEDGVFDFTLSDLRVKNAQEKNLFLLCNLDWVCGLEGEPPSYAQIEGKYFDDAKYLEYLDEVVERYDGDGIDDMPGLTKPIKYWEIGNEIMNQRMFSGTAEDYAHVLKISYENIKRNCPDCRVLIGGWVTGQGGGIDEEKWQRALDYFERVLAAGGGNYFDIMNYHEYTNGCDFLTYYHVNAFNELLAKYGFEKHIWITESNTRLVKDVPRPAGQFYTIERQAQDIVKRIVVAFDAGVEVFFWHGLDGGWNEPGLIDRNGVPKPCYYSLKLLIEKIDGFSSVERIDLGDNETYFYKFIVDNDSVWVLWTESEVTLLDLSKYFNQLNLEITYSITSYGESDPEKIIVKKDDVTVTKTPIFISEYQSVDPSLQVKKSTVISCSVSPSEPNITEDDTLTVSGTITPPLGGKKVTLTYIQPNSETLTKTRPDGSLFTYKIPDGLKSNRTVTTGSDGGYTDSFKLTETGLWSVKASWNGDTTHHGASSSQSFFVDPGSSKSFIKTPLGITIISGGIIAIIITTVFIVLRKLRRG